MISLREERLFKQALTLLELLAVIAVLAILTVLFVPVAATLLDRGKLAKDTGNLRQIGIAHQQYAADNRMTVIEGFRPAIADSPLQLWFVNLRPYLDGKTSMATACPILISPLDPKQGGESLSYEGKRRSYNVNRGLTEGTGTARKAKSLLAIQNPKDVILAGWHKWYETNTNVIMNDVPASLELIPAEWNDGYAQFVFLDGHVERIEVSSLMPGGVKYWQWTGIKTAPE
jgi:prepilin-type N-terminal cleavage/methylation domain-containing protein/prepilin-type processing-associated H-X9-DG protein